MRTDRNWWLVLALIAFFTIVFIASCGVQAQDVDLAGLYDVTGTHPDGEPYTGTATIVRDGEQWEIHWLIEPGGESIGLGLMQGDTLSFIYQTGSGAVGLSVLRVDRNDNTLVLSGPWLAPGTPTLGRETLTRRKASTVDPRFPV